MTPRSNGRTEVPDLSTPARPPNKARLFGRRSLELIGNTPLLRLERLTRDLARHPDSRQGRMVQSRRIGEGSRRLQYRRPGAGQRQIRTRQNSARFHQRKYRNRLCHDRSRRRFSGDPVHAGKCFGRTQTHPARLRRQHYLYRSRRRLRRRHPHRPRTLRQRARQIFLCRPVFQRRQLAGPLPWHSQRNLATNRRAASRTSCP